MSAPALGVRRSLRTAWAGLSRPLQAAHERARTRRALVRRFPPLKRAWKTRRPLLEELAGPHRDYVRRVSSQDMALSLETAAFLWLLCRALRPRRILDLGSGFSSYVLRRHAATQAGVSVLSVDDDAAWLERTRGHLAGAGLPDAGLLDWTAFRASPGEPFDLVLHDLGSMPTRISALPFVLDRVVPGRGVLLLDDVHKPAYAAAAAELLARRRHRRIDLAPLVRDRFGRHGWLVTDLGDDPETRP